MLLLELMSSQRHPPSSKELGETEVKSNKKREKRAYASENCKRCSWWKLDGLVASYVQGHTTVYNACFSCFRCYFLTELKVPPKIVRPNVKYNYKNKKIKLSNIFHKAS